MDSNSPDHDKKQQSKPRPKSRSGAPSDKNVNRTKKTRQTGNALRPKKTSRKSPPWFPIGIGIGVAALVIAIVLTSVLTTSPDGTSAGAGPGDPAVGAQLYGANCAQCHGADLGGTAQGPPFLDKIYAPNHHADASFSRAVANGVQPHHWGFGAMPAQPQIDDVELADIIAYVRQEQSAAGITNDPTHS